MDRRRAIAALAYVVAVIALPSANAQPQPKVWRIGFLAARSRDATFEYDISAPFLQGMHGLGYIEGKNVQYEWRAEANYGLLPSLAADLVKLNVDVIVALGTPPVRAAQQATRSIPIVMVSVNDPVDTGLVASLAKPGSNTTGVANLSGESSQKQLDLLIATVPKLSRIAVLLNPNNQTSEGLYRNVQEAAQQRKVDLVPIQARTIEDLERAFATMTREGVQGFILTREMFFIQQRSQIVSLAATARMPAIYPLQEYSEIGGLMSYGASSRDISRRAAFYVDKILKGANPAQIPVEQPTELKLVINVKTAKALGLTIPKELLLRADEVIE